MRALPIRRHAGRPGHRLSSPVPDAGGQGEPGAGSALSCRPGSGGGVWVGEPVREQGCPFVFDRRAGFAEQAEAEADRDPGTIVNVTSSGLTEPGASSQSHEPAAAAAPVTISARSW